MKLETNNKALCLKSLRRVGLVFVILLAASPRALAEPQINEKREFYDIRGGSESELKNEMNTKGINDGRMNDAYTKWYVRWDFDYGSGAPCRFRAVRVSADIDIKLPRWQNERDGSDELRQKWDRFLKALEEHENGHRDFGVKAATEIDAELSRMPAFPNCTELGAAANAKAYEILGKYQGEEKAYDAETNHGINKGAVFP